MKKYNAKGCIYVISDLVGGDNLLWTDYIETLIRNNKDSKFKFVFQKKEFEFQLGTAANVNKAIKEIKKKLRSISNIERISHLKQLENIKTFSELNVVPYEYLIANWDDLKSLDKNVLEIGSHTKTHPNLKMIETEKEFSQELSESKLEIEKKIGYPIRHLCYPGGSFNKKIINQVRQSGYLTSTTVINGLNSQKADLFKLKRLLMKNDFALFKAKISGLDTFIRHFVRFQ